MRIYLQVFLIFCLLGNHSFAYQIDKEDFATKLLMSSLALDFDKLELAESNDDFNFLLEDKINEVAENLLSAKRLLPTESDEFLSAIESAEIFLQDLEELHPTEDYVETYDYLKDKYSSWYDYIADHWKTILGVGVILALILLLLSLTGFKPDVEESQTDKFAELKSLKKFLEGKFSKIEELHRRANRIKKIDKLVELEVLAKNLWKGSEKRFSQTQKKIDVNSLQKNSFLLMEFESTKDLLDKVEIVYEKIALIKNLAIEKNKIDLNDVLKKFENLVDLKGQFKKDIFQLELRAIDYRKKPLKTVRDYFELQRSLSILTDDCKSLEKTLNRIKKMSEGVNNTVFKNIYHKSKNLHVDLQNFISLIKENSHQSINNFKIIPNRRFIGFGAKLSRQIINEIVKMERAQKDYYMVFYKKFIFYEVPKDLDVPESLIIRIRKENKKYKKRLKEYLEDQLALQKNLSRSVNLEMKNGGLYLKKGIKEKMHNMKGVSIQKTSTHTQKGHMIFKFNIDTWRFEIVPVKPHNCKQHINQSALERIKSSIGQIQRMIIRLN